MRNWLKDGQAASGGTAETAPRAASSFTKNYTREDIQTLKTQVLAKIGTYSLEEYLAPGRDAQLTQYLITTLRSIVPYPVPDLEDEVITQVKNELCGFGPLEPLLNDPDITEIMVVGPFKTWIEKKGKKTFTDVRFDNETHLRATIDRIVQPLGRKIDIANPICDARLPDGHRVHVTIAPVATNGTELTIRKHPHFKMKPSDLVKLGSAPQWIFDYLEECVIAGKNMLISGGTGSGKTTMLNVLSNFIREDERIVSMEDTRELDISCEHTIYLETRETIGDKKETMNVTMPVLVKSSLRMRPDRIIVGECRGSEAREMLQAMNTGHDGSLGTIHANSPRDALSRLEYMCTLDKEIPLSSLRNQISAAVHIIIQVMRDRNTGRRRIVEISEIGGLEAGDYMVNPIFIMKYPLRRGEEDELKWTGYVPTFASELLLPEGFFDHIPIRQKEVV